MEGYDIRGTELKKAFEAAVVICGASCKAELSRMAGISESTIQSCVDRERIRKDTAPPRRPCRPRRGRCCRL